MLVLRKEHEKYFKRFNIISLLGQGSFGTVYNVHDKSTNERFALKEIQINLNHCKSFVNEILPPGITHPNILCYSPLMISKRPVKLTTGINIFGRKKEIFSKPVQNINFYEELISNNLNCNITQYEDFSSPDITYKEEIKKIDNPTPYIHDNEILNTNIRKKKSIPFINKRYINNSNLININRTRSWGVSTQMNISNKYKRNKSANTEYFLYLKTKICAFSLRDFLDVRNNRIFGKKEDVKESLICYEGILNSKVKIPVGLFNKSIDEDTKICRKHSLNIFRYILLGLLFLHSLGIAHNDIKSSNIFMDGSDSYIPKIGDFGSKTICGKHLAHEELFSTKEYLYCHNRTIIECNHQTPGKIFDCRSLAPILFELLHPFKTHSEMISVIKYLKKTLKVPSFFRISYPKESDLLETILNDADIKVKNILAATDNILKVI